MICGQEVYAVQLQYVNRYFNIVGNVLGQSGIQIVYDDNPATVSSPGGNISKAIYAVGWAGQNGTYSSEVAPTNDMLSVTSLMRWGNYDAVNAAVRWNSLEVPSNLTDTTGSPSRYANPVPANQTLPNSFFPLATILVGHTLWHTALACRWPGCDWRKHSRCRRSREQYSGGTLLCEHSHRSCVSAFLCRQRSNLVLRRGNTQWPRWAQSPRGKLRSLASTLPVTMALLQMT